MTSPTGTPRPIVPPSWRRRVFDVLHNLSHPGVRASHKLVSSKFVWYGMNKHIGEWAKACITCQTSKVARHIRALLRQFELPHQRFDDINVNLVGPLPPSQGFSYLFTIVRSIHTMGPRPSHLPIFLLPLAPVPFFSIGSLRFGLPSNISSDRGVQFTSQLWTELAELFGRQAAPHNCLPSTSQWPRRAFPSAS